MSRPIPPRYMQPHQARTAEPTPYEDLLGDSIERAYAAGVTELKAMVEFLNKFGPFAPNGVPWSEDMFCAEMKRLGA